MITCPATQSDDSVALAISVGPPPTHKVWATESGFLFPVLSDFWPHGAVSQAYGVFNEDTGFSNRGTFVIDRSGIIRFAEMKRPVRRATSRCGSTRWPPSRRRGFRGSLPSVRVPAGRPG